jgi:hypothetical protein
MVRQDCSRNIDFRMFNVPGLPSIRAKGINYYTFSHLVNGHLPDEWRPAVRTSAKGSGFRTLRVTFLLFTFTWGSLASESSGNPRLCYGTAPLFLISYKLLYDNKEGERGETYLKPEFKLEEGVWLNVRLASG